MSPRFERRPERRSGPGGPGRSPAGSPSAGRPSSGRPSSGRPSAGRPTAGRPSAGGERSWGAGKPEWRPQPRGAWRGEGRPEGRPEGRSEGRPDRRPERRPEGRFEARFEGRFERRSSEGPAPRGERRSGPERPGSRFGDRPPQRRGPERDGGPERRPFRSRDERPGRPDRFGPRRDLRRDGPRDGLRDGQRFGQRDSWRPAEDDARPQGEAQTLGSEPPSDLIWGRHSAQAALESGRPIHRIWCTGDMRHSPKFLQLLREAKASGVLVEEVTWARLGQLTGGAVHQGIVLQSAAADTLDLSTLIEGCSQIGEAPLLMAIDGLTDPHNLGAIVRSAEALGAHGMVLPQRRCAGLTGSVAKVAAGALEHLPVARVVNLNRALDTLKQEGYRVVGLAAEGNLTLEEADLDGPLVVVTGSEGDGLSLLTRRSCDQLVRIPLRGATPSLNASVATALLLYEIARRGWMGGLKGQAPAPRISRPQLPTAAAEAPETEAVETEADADADAGVEALPSQESVDPVAAEPEPNDTVEAAPAAPSVPAVAAAVEALAVEPAVAAADAWSGPAASDGEEDPFSSDIRL